MGTAELMGKVKSAAKTAVLSMKNAIRPSGVTWMKPKRAAYETALTLAVVIVVGVSLACADALFGSLFGLMLG